MVRSSTSPATCRVRFVRRCRCACLALVLALASACGDGGTAPSVEPPEPPSGPCTVAAQCRARLPLPAGGFLPHYSTHRLGEGAHAGVVQGVVVVHGTNRNADDYFERVVEAARLAALLESTVVAAPHFQTRDDGPRFDEPYWTSSGWKRGHPSEGSAPALSSYAALDAVVLRLADKSRFPNLSRLVVTGHSAGGQVAHRYAAGSALEDGLSGYAVRYVVANPSTYLYPTPVRELSPENFLVPDVSSCPDYDAWHYGLQNLNPYMLRTGAELARRRLLGRRVVVLLGEQDTGTASLDQSCGADVQGANRLQRGLALVRVLSHEFAGHRHEVATVPGVGHSSRAMYQSPQGRAALFAWSAAASLRQRSIDVGLARADVR